MGKEKEMNEETKTLISIIEKAIKDNIISEEDVKELKGVEDLSVLLRRKLDDRYRKLNPDFSF